MFFFLLMVLWCRREGISLWDSVLFWSRQQVNILFRVFFAGIGSPGIFLKLLWSFCKTE